MNSGDENDLVAALRRWGAMGYSRVCSRVGSPWGARRVGPGHGGASAERVSADAARDWCALRWRAWGACCAAAVAVVAGV